MTHVADDTALGKFARQQHDWFRRVREGSLDPVVVGRIVQGYVDGKLQNVECVLDGTHRIVEIEKPAVPPLFRYLDTVKIAAIPSFDVSAHFKVGKTDGVKVGYIDGFFTSCFGGLVEEAQPPLALRRNELTRTAYCADINTALGEGVEEATCGQIWALMKRQGQGRRGKLHVDGRANLFRVRDAKGVLRLVNVLWHAGSGGWVVGAGKVDHGLAWDAGRLVFSHTRAA
ncbi:hypothetical protein IPJ70_02420 [Candidatus Campbellbacteria bacterium]|nr:MAG: hypothetical protein IPJ70_02420 [Candidatus Campbellbacteria bacterium]